MNVNVACFYYVGCWTYHASSELKCLVSGTFENNTLPILNLTINVNKNKHEIKTVPFSWFLQVFEQFYCDSSFT